MPDLFLHDLLVLRWTLDMCKYELDDACNYFHMMAKQANMDIQ